MELGGVRTPRGIRTPNLLILSQAPLPLGYQGKTDFPDSNGWLLPKSQCRAASRPKLELDLIDLIGVLPGLCGRSEI